MKSCNGVKRVIMVDFVEFGEYQRDFELFSLRQPIAMVPFRSQRPLHFKVAIECYKSIINCILLHLGRELKPSSETFHKQNGFDMICISLCGEKSVKIFFGVKMTCQTCLYAQQVTPTSQLAFQAPLKNLRNAQQRELNQKEGCYFFTIFHFKLSFRTFDADCFAKLLFTILLIFISIIQRCNYP